MSGTGTPGRQQVSKGLPEGYLEEFKHGIRDYFNGVIPIGLAAEHIEEIASKAYHRICEHTQPTLDSFRGIATFIMMVAELKQAGFDSLKTEKDIFRAFNSFKFRRYLRKIRKQGRTDVKIRDKEIAALDLQVEVNEKAEQERIKRIKAKEQKIAENTRSMAECNREMAKCDQELAEYDRQMAAKDRIEIEIKQKMAENEKILANNRRIRAEEEARKEAVIAEKLNTIKNIKSKMSPEGAKMLEDLWKAQGYNI